MSSESIATEPVSNEPIVVTVSNDANTGNAGNAGNADLKSLLKAEIMAELKAEMAVSSQSSHDANENEKHEEEKPVVSPVVQDEHVEDSSNSSCLDIVNVVNGILKKEAAVASANGDDQEAIELSAAAKSVESAKPIVSSLSTILTVCGKALQKDVHITSDNLIVILHSIMESIESLKLMKTLPALTGAQKKQLCIDCLKWIINNQSDIENNEKAALLILVDSIAPNAIDIMISVSNGASELVLMTVKRCQPCFPKGCCFM